MDQTMQMLHSPGGSNSWANWGKMEHTNWMDEQLSSKKTCYIGDWTFLPILRLKGPDAVKLSSETSVNSFAKFPIGKSKHIIQCNNDGMIITQGVCMHTGDDEYLLEWTPAWYTDYLVRQGKYNVTAEFIQETNFQVAGPNALLLIEKLCGESSLRDVPYAAFGNIRIKGIPTRALRLNMAGEIGFELQAPRERYQEVYDAIMEAGQEYGIRRMGSRIAMTNHVESFFPTTGWDYIPAIYNDEMAGFRDYLCSEHMGPFRWVPMVFRVGGSFEAEKVSDYYRDPVELNWGNRIKFDHEFVGRKALEKIVANPKRTSVSLVWNAEDCMDVYGSLFKKDEEFYDYMELPRDRIWAMRLDNILKDGKIVGQAVSRIYSTYFREMISLATIDPQYAAPGTQVVVVWGTPGGRQKQIRATVAPVPYKKGHDRIDLRTLPSYLKK